MISAKKILVFISIVLLLAVGFLGNTIIKQKRSMALLQEENKYMYLRCLEQIADRIEDYQSSKNEVSLRNASTWAGKAEIASQNMSLEKKQYLAPLAVLMDEFFANTTRPDTAAKSGKLYKLAPCLRGVANDPNNQQKIDDLTYALQGAY